jgi:DNA-binding IclR family transcriptional regulator
VPEAGSNGSRTLARGLSVLSALGSASDGATVAELSEATSLDRAVLYRLLETLGDTGFVVRDPETRKYHLGVALVELGSRASRGLEVRRLALPGMRLLMEQTREAVRRHLFNPELRTEILRPVLGDSAGVFGAALLTVP